MVGACFDEVSFSRQDTAVIICWDVAGDGSVTRAQPFFAWCHRHRFDKKNKLGKPCWRALRLIWWFHGYLSHCLVGVGVMADRSHGLVGFWFCVLFGCCLAKLAGRWVRLAIDVAAKWREEKCGEFPRGTREVMLMADWAVHSISIMMYYHPTSWYLQIFTILTMASWGLPSVGTELEMKMSKGVYNYYFRWSQENMFYNSWTRGHDVVSSPIYLKQ